jgi:transcriptional regulator with XRE-family HTH domain
MHKKKPGPPKGKKHSEVERSSFGERLFKTRKIRGLSQTELGERTDLSRRMVSHYEGNAPEGPPLMTLTKIADALNVTVSYLLGESTLKAIKDDVKPNLRKHINALQERRPRNKKQF